MRIAIGVQMVRSAVSYQCWRPAARKLDKELNDLFWNVTSAMNVEAGRAPRVMTSGAGR